MNDWVDVAIATLLRTGVVLSIAIVTVGIIFTFAHHPDYFSSRPALGTLTSASAHFPSSIADVVAGLRVLRGQSIVMAGLLLLIATPVARVALSVVVFVVERDRLYIIITTTVLIILLTAFALGAT